MTKTLAPHYPIIYVRGFAMTEGEIEATTATPYMGFNLGSTKIAPALGWFGPASLLRVAADSADEGLWLLGCLSGRAPSNRPASGTVDFHSSLL